MAINFDLLSRKSTPSRLLGEPGPSADQLDRLLHLAVRTPDHGMLMPWRFIRIAGNVRTQLGKILERITLEKQPDAVAAVLEKERLRFAKAPLIITVIAQITPNHKIPEQEQLLSAGCVAYNLLQGAQAMGFGAQWLTAWMAYDDQIAAIFKLASNEKIVGFIHIGTASDAIAERPRPDPKILLSDLVISDD